MSKGLPTNSPEPERSKVDLPLRGAEEREFIQRCVRKQILTYAGVFGVANLVALGALFYSVHEASNAAAKSEAQDYVRMRLDPEVKQGEKFIDEFVNLAKKDTETATDRISQFDKDYPHLLATKERLEGDLQALQKSLARVKILTDKESIPQLAGLASALQKYIESGGDVSTLLTKVQGQNDGLDQRVSRLEDYEQKTLNPRLDKLENGLQDEKSTRSKSYDQLSEALGSKVSLNTRYWIKSMKGDWLVGYNTPGHGLGMTLGSPANGGNELQVQWEFLDHWPW